ncbi:hypothetical protein FQN54_007907 [Arachnomyces sp. PD_36]|nr:hypothetical protein FQN54_007907 [Arachnomyces sp. PD_36]
MVEVLAIVSGGLTIASFDIEISEKIVQIKRFLDSVKSASPEIEACLEEIEILNEILLDWEKQTSTSSDNTISWRCAHQCRRTAELISELVQDFQAKIRKRKFRESVDFALKKSDLERILGQLERAKSTLSIAHLISQRRLHAQWAERHDNTIQTLIDRTISDTSQISLASSPPSLTLSKSQHKTSGRPAFRAALPTWLSGKVWEVYTAKSQVEWAFRMRIYNIIPCDSLIFQYAKDGNVDGLKYLLHHEQRSIFDCDSEGQNALCKATESGQISACQYLLDAGADPNHFLILFLASLVPLLKHNRRGSLVAEHVDSELRDLTLRLISETQDNIVENPKHYIHLFHGDLLQAVLATIQPSFYQRPLSERLELFHPPHDLLYQARKPEDILLVLTASERQNTSLYRDKLLPLILEFCWMTINIYAKELDGYHLLLTSVLRDCFSQLGHTYACSSPQSLVLLCLRGWACSFAVNPMFDFPEHGRLKWLNEKLLDMKYTPVQILAKALEAAGVDLLRVGNEERSLLAKDLVDQDITIRLEGPHCSKPRVGKVRLISITHGPKPEDWHCWLSDFTDEFAGEFWEMVELDEPRLRLPGAWILAVQIISAIIELLLKQLFVTVEVVEARGDVVPDAEPTVAFSIDGPEKIVSTDNGDQTDFNPFLEPERRALAGKALAIVKTERGASGELTVLAEADSLESGVITVAVE